MVVTIARQRATAVCSQRGVRHGAQQARQCRLQVCGETEATCQEFLPREEQTYGAHAVTDSDVSPLGSPTAVVCRATTESVNLEVRYICSGEA